MTYEWQQAAATEGPYSAIANATAKTCQLTASEQGKFIKVKVVGTGNYTGEKTSAATAAVAAAGG